MRGYGANVMKKNADKTTNKTKRKPAPISRPHSSFYRDIRYVQGIIIAVALVMLIYTAYFQIVTADTVVNRPFVDVRTLNMVNRLVRNGVIYVDRNDQIILDETALTQYPQAAARANRIRSLLPFMDIRRGIPALPESAVSIRFAATVKQNQPRGAILDRYLRPLAIGNENQRQYPLADAGFPVTGAVHSIYRSAGAEQRFDTFLTSDKPAGFSANLQRFISGPTIIPPDIVLTIDKDIQQAAKIAMADYTGAVIVLDVDTGDILAAVSTPSFDPSDTSLANWRRLQDTNLALNRCWDRRYPPGSTFKVITAAALLESEIIDGHFRFNCTGRHAETRVNEFRMTAHGMMDISSAIRVSCNVFFSEAALRLQSELKTVAEQFGFNRSFSLEPAGASNVFPAFTTLNSRIYELDELVTARNPDTGRIFFRERHSAYTLRDYTRNRGTTGRTGIGQGTLEATPLQMALAASVIATGGILREPNLVAGIRTGSDSQTENSTDFEPFSKTGVDISQHTERHENNQNFDAFERRPDKRILTAETAQHIARAMESVMTDGTGAGMPRLYLHPSDGLILRNWVEWDQCIRIAGKTGSAQVEDKETHSWFISYGPVDSPKYVVAVLCEHAGLGGHHAGPVAMKVYEYLFTETSTETSSDTYQG
jgi:penicillin-binding protein A